MLPVVDQLLYISYERLKLETPARALCSQHSMQPSPNYFGLLFAWLLIILTLQVTPRHDVALPPIPDHRQPNIVAYDAESYLTPVDILTTSNTQGTTGEQQPSADDEMVLFSVTSVCVCVSVCYF